MRLSEFISARQDLILAEWDSFAATLLPAAAGLGRKGLRDHAQEMLSAIAADIAVEQSETAQTEKSQGLAPTSDNTPRTAAQTHAILRARDGFDINQMAAEYRALRAAVLKLWLAETDRGPDDLQDVIRFNEAIDQALTESICDFTLALERTRNLLLGMLGHDMRNPLSVIITTASHLAQLNAGDEVQSAAVRLARSSSRIQALVSDLIDFSRTQLGLGVQIFPASVDLAALFREEVDLQLAANRGRVVTLDVSGNVAGSWDAGRLHQVLGNLVSNALKYGTAGTPVRVELRGLPNAVQFSVANAGEPIPDDLAEAMFEPLVRGPASKDQDLATDTSMGLGLFITREIVRAHRGTVAVRSDGTGTAFAVELPR